MANDAKWSQEYKVYYRSPSPTSSLKLTDPLEKSSANPKWILVAAGEQAVPCKNHFNFIHETLADFFKRLGDIIKPLAPAINVITASNPVWFEEIDDRKFEAIIRAFKDFSDNFHRPPATKVYFLGFAVKAFGDKFDGRLGRFNSLMSRIFKKSGQYLSLDDFISQTIENESLIEPQRGEPSRLADELNALILSKALERLMNSELDDVSNGEIAKSADTENAQDQQHLRAEVNPQEDLNDVPKAAKKKKHKKKKKKNSKALQREENSAADLEEEVINEETIQELKRLSEDSDHIDSLLSSIEQSLKCRDSVSLSNAFLREFFRPNIQEVYKSRKAFYYTFSQIEPAITETLDREELSQGHVVKALLLKMRNLPIEKIGEWFKKGIADYQPTHLKLLLTEDDNVAAAYFIVFVYSVFVIDLAIPVLNDEQYRPNKYCFGSIVGACIEAICEEEDDLEYGLRRTDNHIVGKDFRNRWSHVDEREFMRDSWKAVIFALKELNPLIDDSADDRELGKNIKKAAKELVRISNYEAALLIRKGLANVRRSILQFHFALTEGFMGLSLFLKSRVSEMVLGSSVTEDQKYGKDAEELDEPPLTEGYVNALRFGLSRPKFLQNIKSSLASEAKTIQPLEAATRFKLAFVKKGSKSVFRSKKCFYSMFAAYQETFKNREILLTTGDDLGVAVKKALHSFANASLNELGRIFKGSIKEAPHLLPLLFYGDDEVPGVYFLNHLHDIFVTKETRLPNGNEVVRKNQMEVLVKELCYQTESQKIAVNFKVSTKRMSARELPLAEAATATLKHFNPRFDPQGRADEKFGNCLKTTVLRVLSDYDDKEIGSVLRKSIPASTNKETANFYKEVQEHTDELLCLTFLATMRCMLSGESITSAVTAKESTGTSRRTPQRFGLDANDEDGCPVM